MQSLKRDLQKVYKLKTTKENVVDQYGDETGETKNTFRIDKCCMVSVSSTSGTPANLEIGAVVDYDRYITVYHNKYEFNEGDFIFVDVSPVVENDIVTNKPDYIVKKKLATKKGIVSRYGISKVNE